MAYLARMRSVAQQVEAYRRLLQHLDSYRRIPVLGFDEAAAGVFQRLRRTHRRIGAMDVKIAAIVLSQNATLLSRNGISRTFAGSRTYRSRTEPPDSGHTRSNR
jgi:tRNA(fMet)-specific endonuclease VapC